MKYIFFKSLFFLLAVCGTEALLANEPDHSTAEIASFFQERKTFLSNIVRTIFDKRNELYFYGSATLVGYDNGYSYWVTNFHILSNLNQANHLRSSGGVLSQGPTSFEPIGFIPGKDLSFFRIKENGSDQVLRRTFEDVLLPFIGKKNEHELSATETYRHLLIAGKKTSSLDFEKSHLAFIPYDKEFALMSRNGYDPLIQQPPSPYDWLTGPSLVKRLTKCPAYFLQSCYMVNIRLGGFSGGPALEVTPNPSILGIVSHISPLSYYAFIIPWEEVLQSFEKAKATFSNGDVYFETQDASQTFQYQDKDTIKILKGPWKDTIIRNRTPDDFTAGGDGTGGGGDGTGGGGDGTGGGGFIAANSTGNLGIGSSALKDFDQNVLFKGISTTLNSRDGVTLIEGQQNTSFNKLNRNSIRGIQDFISFYSLATKPEDLDLRYEKNDPSKKIEFHGNQLSLFQGVNLPITTKAQENMPSWRFKGVVNGARVGFVRIDPLQGQGSIDVILHIPMQRTHTIHRYQLQLKFDQEELTTTESEIILQGNLSWTELETTDNFPRYNVPSGNFFLALRKSIYTEQWELKLAVQDTEHKQPDFLDIYSIYSPVTLIPVITH